MSKLVNFERREREEARFVSHILRWLDYLPSGDLVTRMGRKSVVGFGPKSRRYVTIDGTRHSSAKIVWVWHHKAFPPSPLKHMNGDRTDDRIENLGAKILDGTIEGAGDRWIARPKGFKRRGDVIGVFRTYEKALAAFEAWERAADLV